MKSETKKLTLLIISCIVLQLIIKVLLVDYLGLSLLMGAWLSLTIACLFWSVLYSKLEKK